ncbi:response regulator [Actinophytocola sp.]|uniref:response regulator n=1 Tax=Actinophytocola sp. TaxID=1872138 RepID=UPI003899D70C
MRVVLAEDGVLLREGLAGMLDRFGLTVVASVSDASSLVEAATRERPDLVVTDIRMPPGYSNEGLQAAVALRRDRPELAVVALSQYVERGYAADLLDSHGGVGIGYLLKDRVVDVAEFVEVLRRVAAGGTAIDPEVVRHLLDRDPLNHGLLDRLSAREREVLALIAEGHSNAAIARHLTITEGAVGKHVGNLLAKLDLSPDEDVNRRVLAVLTYLRNQ